MKFLNKLQAIEYLVEHNCHQDEWSGCGMYLKIEEIVKSTNTTFERSYLDRLIEAASMY